ncbi:hypothetical protein pb186bvf_010290 [Paramecium bursaria]
MQSEQDWVGIKSSKFNYNEKVHLRVNDCMVNYQGNTDGLGLGRRHFEEPFGLPHKWQPSLVVNVPKPGDGQSQEFPPGKKRLEVDVKEKKPRAQRSHVKEGVSGHIEDIPYGIKTYPEFKKDQSHDVEQMMGQKKRLEYLTQMRNGLNVVSLGDKPYKNPEYCEGFYKSGGLIAGSTQVQRKVNINQLHEKEMEKKLQEIQSQIKKGMKWSDRLKLDNEISKKKDLDELDTWVETILKPSNPGYQDPEKFFENLEKQQQADPKKNAAANQKKGKK